MLSKHWKQAPRLTSKPHKVALLLCCLIEAKKGTWRIALVFIFCGKCGLDSRLQAKSQLSLDAALSKNAVVSSRGLVKKGAEPQ